MGKEELLKNLEKVAESKYAKVISDIGMTISVGSFARKYINSKLKAAAEAAAKKAYEEEIDKNREAILASISKLSRSD